MDDLKLTAGAKETRYLSLIPQIAALTEDESDLVACMANICAALKQQFNFLWVGFYLVKQEELVLGPFQGPVACTRIAKGKGVCGTAWEQNKILVVPDVNAFPGHIACNSVSRSEIVVPVTVNNRVVAVLDIDSEEYGQFDDTDSKYLEQVINLIRCKW